jgi:hypothetical protein
MEETIILLATETTWKKRRKFLGWMGKDAPDTVSLQDAAAVFIDDLACERKIEQNGGQS